MLAIISRAACFILFIVLGFFLKRIGFFHEKDFSVLSKVVIRITLPAAIIVNFNGKEKEGMKKYLDKYDYQRGDDAGYIHTRADRHGNRGG